MGGRPHEQNGRRTGRTAPRPAGCRGPGRRRTEETEMGSRRRRTRPIGARFRSKAERARLNVAPEESAEDLLCVVSVLVAGDETAPGAVTAEGLIKATLWEHQDGAQPIASTVARFEDLDGRQQTAWRDLLAREADGFV